MENSNKKKWKKAIIYSVLSKVLKWLSIGLGIAGVIAGITVGVLSGTAPGLVTLFGCWLFGVGSYTSSVMSQAQSLALAAELQPHQEPTREINDKNTLHINVQENTNTNELNTNKFYTVDVKNTSIDNTPLTESKKFKSDDGTEYYTVPTGSEEVKYHIETLEK